MHATRVLASIPSRYIKECWPPQTIRHQYLRAHWANVSSTRTANHAPLQTSLVTHAVIVGNTVDMAEAVAQLTREGYPVNESDLAHIWPTRYEHIHVYGR